MKKTITKTERETKAEIIARIEREIQIREGLGFGNEQMLPGLKAAIAIIDPEYFQRKYLQDELRN